MRRPSSARRALPACSIPAALLLLWGLSGPAQAANPAAAAADGCTDGTTVTIGASAAHAAAAAAASAAAAAATPASSAASAPQPAASAPAAAASDAAAPVAAAAPAPLPTLCGLRAAVTPAGAAAPVPVNRYMGIEYAKADRFKPPVMLAPGGNLVAQTVPGPFCPQSPRPQIPVSAQDERCLYLNVFTPQAAVGAAQSAPGRLPVLFYIHGGGFTRGGGYLPLYDSRRKILTGNLYDGSYLAAAGNMVVVTINYRLGALGFLAIDDPVENAALGGPLRGNFGILDQQMALQWVQKYIADFGGDPARVTIAGASAGAMAAGLHLFAAPGSAGTFQAAIMQSNPVASLYRTTAQAQKLGDVFLDALCSRVTACVRGRPVLQRATTAQIVTAQSAGVFGQQVSPRTAAAREATALPLARLLGEASLQIHDGLPWSPNVDGRVVVSQPLAGFASAAGLPPKPFVFGMNRDEGAVFAHMAYLRLGSGLDPLSFNRILISQVWPKDGQTILNYDKATQGRPMYPYRAPGAPAPGFMNGTAVTLASLIDDFAFRCGNLALAGRAVKQAQAAPTAAPVFGYLFSQPPLLNQYYAGRPESEVEACSPGSGNVCHGAEVPYVFHTLDAAYAAYVHGTQPPPPDSQALTNTMSAAWASFVNNPAQPAPWTPSPGRGSEITTLPGAWTPYTGLTSSLAQWSTAPGSPARISASAIDSASNCSALWDKVAPISGL